MEEPLDEEPNIDWDGMKSHVTGYIKNRIEYFKLSLIEYIAEVAESVVLAAILAVIILTLWFFANITAAIALGEVIGKMSIGFLIVTGFNFMLGIIIIAARKPLLLKPISSHIIKILSKSLEADENR